MLRVTVTENASEQRWVLQGRLTGGSIEELRTSWCANQQYPGRRRIVDLNDVTAIDKEGERMILTMIREGAELIANGLYTRHLLESLALQGEGALDLPKS